MERDRGANDRCHGAHCTTQDSEGGNTTSKGTLKSKDVKEFKKKNLWEHFSKKKNVKFPYGKPK
jgi:hypothetical protein